MQNFNVAYFDKVYFGENIKSNANPSRMSALSLARGGVCPRATQLASVIVLKILDNITAKLKTLTI